ncbi:Chemotaxis protein CheW [bioreactor metagenome]|uniref:Chemotaxis protein CheW n=1 Tax=bioreactor metagenome TaxID=1076179 RepID=A0A645IRM9_9ZZZZ
MIDLLKSLSENREDAMAGRFLTFLVDKETFGIEIRHVMEIIGLQPITEMPEMPDYVKGIINLRGRIIPVLDVGLRFKKLRREYDDRTCIIVISLSGTSVGLIVDNVSEVLTIPDEDISAKPEILSKDSRGYIKSIGKIGEQVILLIDCDKLLNEHELEAISA